jgi:hypothetical protein
MEDDDSESDAEMAEYGTDFSDDVDPNFDATGSSLPGHSRIGNRIPRFPGFGGDFPIPDSRLGVVGPGFAQRNYKIGRLRLDLSYRDPPLPAPRPPPGE